MICKFLMPDDSYRLLNPEEFSKMATSEKWQIEWGYGGIGCIAYRFFKAGGHHIDLPCIARKAYGYTDQCERCVDYKCFRKEMSCAEYKMCDVCTGRECELPIGYQPVGMSGYKENKMDEKQVWIVGQYRANIQCGEENMTAWDLIGVFDNREAAVKVCLEHDENHFVGQITLNDEHVAEGERVEWPGLIYRDDLEKVKQEGGKND